MCARACVELRRVAGKLLAERERRGVLQMRAADLDDVGGKPPPWRTSVARERLERRAEDRASRLPRRTMFIAVGNTSFEDWPRLTSSFGWTSRSSPRGPPRISEARLASTSLTFMLVWVPEPVCQTASGNSPSCLPASASSAAATIACAFFASSVPSARFTRAALRFTMSSARMSAGGIFSVEMRKWPSERCVCAPQRCSAGTSIGPKLSRSTRVAGAVIGSLLGAASLTTSLATYSTARFGAVTRLE